MKAKEVLNILNIGHRTLGTYVKKGLLNPIKINTNHYEYDPEEVFSILGKKKERYNITYSRVSLPKQKNDLKTQTKRLYDFATSNGYLIKEQIEDVKSGMSFEDRKGFVKLLKKVTNFEVKNVIIEHKDRLVRFGFELVKMLFEKYGTNIIIISDDETNKTYEQELTDDLLSIIHYYSMKSYSYRRKLNNAAKALKTDDNTED
jgi:predicted site-specific integrase-resolvase